MFNETFLPFSRLLLEFIVNNHVSEIILTNIIILDNHKSRWNNT